MAFPRLLPEIVGAKKRLKIRAVDEKHHYIYGLKGNEKLYRYKFEI